MHSKNDRLIMLLLCIGIYLLPQAYNSSAQAANDTNAYYINNLYFNTKLDILKSGFDRWQQISQSELDGKDPAEINHGIYGIIYDLNIGKDVNGDRIYPQMVGAALGSHRIGFYFLGYTSDFGNVFRKKENYSEGYYNAGTIGANIDLQYIAFHGDASFDSKSSRFYGKVMIPILRTYGGIRFSNFKRVELETGQIDEDEPDHEFQKTEAHTWDIIDAGTSIFRVFNVGFKYYKLMDYKYAPNISASIHQLYNKNDWSELNWDAEIYFGARTQKLDGNIKDYEARFVLYKLIGGPLAKSSSSDGVGVVVRTALFVGVSYKSPEDNFSSSISEEGRTYNGQDGIGFEVGIGLRVLGFKEYGFNEDTYVKFTYFYNYSQYFERYPGIKSGFKFRVVF